MESREWILRSTLNRLATQKPDAAYTAKFSTNENNPISMDGRVNHKAKMLSQPIPAAAGPLIVVNGSCPDTCYAAAEDENEYRSATSAEPLQENEIKLGGMAPSPHLVGAQDEHPPTLELDLPALSSLDTSIRVGTDSEEHKPSSVGSAEQETAPAATESASRESASSADSMTTEQGQRSDAEPEIVVLDLGHSSKEKVYSFKHSGLLVGLPHKVKPSVVLQTRWDREIEPRLFNDVEAFNMRERPVGRTGRRVCPGLSVELRMSGRVKLGGSQVTLVPTVWFLYNDKRFEKATRAFVTGLEWLPEEGFDAHEIQLGGPRFSALEIPADQLHLSNSAHDSISLPGGVGFFMHIEEPKYGTACGLLCCATFVRDGEVVSQHLSRIGGIMSLDTRTAAITTAHGFVEEMVSKIGLWDIQDDNDSDEESQPDDEEATEEHKPERWIGRIDSAILETASWFQLPPESIQETCFFRTNGSSMEQLLLNIMEQHSDEIPVGLGNNSSAKARSQDSRGCPTGDFSFLGLHDRNGLYNYYRSVDDHATAKAEFIYRVAELGEVDGGPVDLLLRPENASRAILVPGTILIGTNRATLHARKIVLDDPLAPGSSGTWVVQDGLLCGIIIASYKDEPFAIMIPSFQIASDIRRVFPYISTVDLPRIGDDITILDLGLPTPEPAHLSHAQHPQQSAGSKIEPAAKRSSTKSTLRPSTLSVDHQIPPSPSPVFSDRADRIFSPPGIAAFSMNSYSDRQDTSPLVISPTIPTQIALLSAAEALSSVASPIPKWPIGQLKRPQTTPTQPSTKVSEDVPQSISKEGSILPMRDAADWRKAMKLEGQVNPKVTEVIERLVENLQQRDLLFLVDDTESMKEHSDKIEVAFETLAYIAKRIDPGDLELSFVSNPLAIFKSRKTSVLLEELRKHLSKHVSVKGRIESSLGDLINDKIIKRLPYPVPFLGKVPSWYKPITIFVFTDGKWGEGVQVGNGLTEPINNLMKEMQKRRLNRTHVMFQFLRFGSDDKGREHLNHLANFGENEPWDIVDTRDINGDVHAMFLAALKQDI